ncbi:hypothetical protein APHAL10511_001585 [Amanita phalloides]|nr:hypothetical protein APHAL10511_001585 [Amanita phalloides]
MADAPAVRRAPVHACPCLNVRIQPAEPQGTPPNESTDTHFTQVFVGDDGIRVVHPHITLRTRAPCVPIEGTSRCGRYTTLTCLICDHLVYRVHQVVPIDILGREGPVLPTEDWVENEIMKSSNGWIEVGSRCLTDDAVQAAESSPSYSSLFSVVLPKLSPPSPTFQGAHDVVLSAVRSPSPQPPVSYLENMKPLLPPAPFSPSHPVFVHLAEMATAQSETLRAQTEEYITRIVKEKIAQVEKAEDELRDQVEAIWLQFKTTVDRIKKEKEKTKSAFTRASHEAPVDPSRTIPVAVKEFVPVPISPARALSPSDGLRMSALSASLATSSFHHPKAASESHALAREGNGSIHSRSSHSSGSTTHVRSPAREGAANVLQFPRNIDDGLNTAVSFRYFMDVEQEMEKKKKERLEEANRKHRASQLKARTSVTAATAAVNGKETEPLQKIQEYTDAHLQVDTEGSVVESSERSPSKGRRHVTFEVEPEVVTINAEAKKPKTELSNGRERDPRADMIFELEEPEGDGSEPSTNGRPQTLPLLEQQTARPARHRHVKSLSAGLPSSFSSLRPLSLPAPSHVRPPLSPHGADMSFQNVMMSLPRQTSLDRHKRLVAGRQTLTEVPEEELDPRDAVILRLVAADTPSHRGAWKPDSEAWKSLTQPLAVKGRGSADVSEEEGETVEDSLALLPSEQSSSDTAEPLSDENGDYSHSRFVGVPGSLPIPIAPVRKQKSPLSLASYQPKAPFADQSGAIVAHLTPRHPSTAALRRASYAERDRRRAMDPGALDFATEDDEEASPSSNDEAEPIIPADLGTRSRKQALKILQKRSAIPEEGMWRSLAT